MENMKEEPKIDTNNDPEEDLLKLVDDDREEITNKSERNSRYKGKGRKYNRLLWLLNRPAFTLTVGRNVRRENRPRLRHLLLKFVRQHNWPAACGVLSALLKDPHKRDSPFHHRINYTIAMDLLRIFEKDVDAYPKKIELLYEETWYKKIYLHKTRRLKDRNMQLESILSCLAQNKSDSAKQTVISLQKQRDSAMNPQSNLIMGLTYYELWYSGVKEELQREHLHASFMPIESDTVANDSSKLEKDMNCDNVDSIFETCHDLHYHSETSVINDKRSKGNINHSLERGVSKGNSVQLVEHHQQIRSQGFYMNSSETSEEDDGASQDHRRKMHSSRVFNAHDLQSLLPLRLPSLDPSLSYGGLFNDDYHNALKCLQLAVNSSPPVCEAALLPLIQLLLLGDQVDEAVVVLQKCCNKSSSVLPFRLMARVWDCFYANNYERLSASFEDVLKKDPTCRHSLDRLLLLHIKGDYSPDRLVEMIALHLEATYADYDIWREFASCLLKLSCSEEDRESICAEQIEDEQRHIIALRRIPSIFVEGMSRTTWKLRCEWWLSRHFSKDMLTSEMTAGELQLMTYKAACASHLYGNEMEYVVRVFEYVKEQDRTMFRILGTHIERSLGLYPYLKRKSRV